MTIRALVVDDEPLARERVRSLIAAERDVTLVAEYGDGASAVLGIERHVPDLLFLDVQMPEMDGFEVLLSLGVPPRAIVFVTAHDAYALRAFDVAAVDYLLKPISEARFRAAVARVRARLATGTVVGAEALAGLLARVQGDRPSPLRFVVRTGSRVSLVPAGDVEWIEATGNYARIHAAGQTHLVRGTMKSIEARLDPARFVRIHRSVIVRVDRIAVMRPHHHGEWVVRLQSGKTFTSSRTRSARLRSLMR